MRLFIALLAFFFPCSAATAAQLQYLSEFPVQHTSKLSLDVQESLPILNFTTKGNQVLKFDLVVQNGSNKLPLVKLPLALQLTLRDLFISLKVNGEELTFDPRGEKVSVPLIQLGQLIDKPMQFIIDSNGYLIDKSDVFATIYKHQPALKDLSIPLMLNEMFFHLFGLAGREFAIGEKIKVAAMPDPSNSLPASITYEILDINDHVITARMEGSIEPRSFSFDPLMGADMGVSKKVEMKLTGDTQGTISWNRTNALLYTLNNHYRYQAEMKFGEMRWNLQMTISNVSSSMPL